MTPVMIAPPFSSDNTTWAGNVHFVRPMLRNTADQVRTNEWQVSLAIHVPIGRTKHQAKTESEIWIYRRLVCSVW